MTTRHVLCWTFAIIAGVQLNAQDTGLRRNADGTFSVPSSALTPAARQALAGFTYQLLPGWSRKTVPGVAYQMAFGKEQDGNPASISVQDIIFDGNLAELEAKTLKETAEYCAKQGFNNFKVVNQSGFETNSKEFGVMAVTQVQRQDGKLVRQFFYFFARKDGKKFCAVCSVADEGMTYDADFDATMKTFQFTK